MFIAQKTETCRVQLINATVPDLALCLRKSGSDGIVYMSVRDEGSECAAVFRARLLSNCCQEHYLCYI
ncbi:RES family NAD+ phosphorylase [Roseovarius sp. C7]|uniref:RES family NAD+ phosphorylase n=1 Tax=Roseovarius sp. C7 TaxID=3398643 RepID=UPI0039F691F9